MQGWLWATMLKIFIEIHLKIIIRGVDMKISEVKVYKNLTWTFVYIPSSTIGNDCQRRQYENL